MFTAIVLVCLSGEFKEPNNCYTFTNEAISETVEECNTDIMTGMDLKLFEYEDPERGQRWEPVDFTCVNWNGMRL